jgi:uncharacterized protein DUF6193
MRQEPDPAVLYPEVAAEGSLAAALQSAAASQGLSLAVVATQSGPLRHATIASVAPHRKAMFVAAGHFERMWWVSGSATNSRLMISGTTNNLDELPKVLLGWAEGASLDEIGRAAPFAVLTGRFEVPDNNPVDVIASEWQWMLKDADRADWLEYQALIEAAHAEPELRRLYPFTSHWTLRFATTPDWSSCVRISVAVDSPRGGGEYTIREHWNGPAMLQVHTAAEAIAIVVERVQAELLETPGGF